jgi:hypothetical protein
MSVSQPTATQIVAGPSQLYVAPVGTTAPYIAGSAGAWPPTFPAGWLPVGYTEKGVDLVYTPTLNPFTPDEEYSPVYDILKAEKAELNIVLAEATLENYQRAISASTLTDDATNKVRKASVGSLPLTYLTLAFTAPAPVGPGAPDASETPDGTLVIVPKVIAGSPITFAASRQSVRLFNVKWEARKIAGQDLYSVFEFYH